MKKIILIFASVSVGLAAWLTWLLPQQYLPEDALKTSDQFVIFLQDQDYVSAFDLTDSWKISYFQTHAM